MVPIEQYDPLRKAFAGVTLGFSVLLLFYWGVQLYKGFALGQW